MKKSQQGKKVVKKTTVTKKPIPGYKSGGKMGKCKYGCS